MALCTYSGSLTALLTYNGGCSTGLSSQRYFGDWVPKRHAKGLQQMLHARRFDSFRKRESHDLCPRCAYTRLTQALVRKYLNGVSPVGHGLVLVLFTTVEFAQHPCVISQMPAKVGAIVGGMVKA